MSIVVFPVVMTMIMAIKFSYTSPTCHRSITSDEVWQLLQQSPCAMTINEIRFKRSDGDTASTNNIYALQTTINDHRTMIDDHRRMIHYIMNTTVNITQFNDFFKEHHSQTLPILKSWRDLSILLLLTIVLAGSLYLIVAYLHPLDLLTRFLLQRHEKKRRSQRPTIPTLRHQQSDASMVYSVEQHQHPHGPHKI